MTLSIENRKKQVEKLQNKDLDLIVIGGGITGSGIALDAVTRGMKTAVFEMQDFAAGTSSRSTKLVHGGLRYLKQLEIGVVAEVGRERAIVYENGPHVTTPEWMLLPFHEGGTFGKFTTSIGLRMYDMLAGVKRSERRKMLSVDETSAKEPLVKKAGLKGGGYYVEYRTDDARLTIEVAKKASELGADLLNYSKVTGFVYENGRAAGVTIEDRITGETYTVKAKKIVNAAGPWVDKVREKDNSKKGKTLHLTKGVHIVIDKTRFPLKQAVYFDTPDGRMVFAIPRGKKAYVGTTDTFYDSDPVNPLPTAEDRSYIIKAIQYMFPEAGITEADIESSWAGVRPLIHEEGKGPSEISRKDEIWVSESGLITIAGGKLTGYRKMSEQVVDRVAEQFEKDYQIKFDKCQTIKLPISGGDVGGSAGYESYVNKMIAKGKDSGLTEDELRYLASMYGSNTGALIELARTGKEEAKAYNLPLHIYAMLAYAVKEESAAYPVDFLLRRTGFILFDIEQAKAVKEGVTDYMAKVYGWDESKKQTALAAVEKAITEAEQPAEAN